MGSIYGCAVQISNLRPPATKDRFFWSRVVAVSYRFCCIQYVYFVVVGGGDGGGDDGDGGGVGGGDDGDGGGGGGGGGDGGDGGGDGGGDDGDGGGGAVVAVVIIVLQIVFYLDVMLAGNAIHPVSVSNTMLQPTMLLLQCY